MRGVVEPSHKGEMPSEYSFLGIEPASVLLGSLKKAEDSDGLIVRLYETAGRDCSARVGFAEKPVNVEETDMIEKEVLSQEYPLREQTVSVEMGGYEIKTLRVSF